MTDDMQTWRDLRTAEDKLEAAESVIERVREWAEEPIPSGADPYQRGIQHAKKIVLSLLDSEGK